MYVADLPIRQRQVGDTSLEPPSLVEWALGVSEVYRQVVAVANRPGLIDTEVEVRDRGPRTPTVGDELSGLDPVVLPHHYAMQLEVCVEGYGAVVVLDEDIVEVARVPVGVQVRVHDVHNDASPSCSYWRADRHFEVIRELVGVTSARSAVALQNEVLRTHGIRKDVERLRRIPEDSTVEA